MKPFRSMVRPSESRDRASAIAFAFHRSELLVLRNGEHLELPSYEQLTQLHLDLGLETYLGDLDGSDLIAWELSERAEEFPEGWELAGLRAVYGAVDDQLFALAGRAVQLLDWRRNHRYCGRCGSPADLVDGDRATRCANCGLFNYPRLSPAVIMTVEREGACLLAHGVNFADGVYSCVAGFVEPGESLEEAVAREVREETGIEVTDVRYFGSQPWPFPNSLMIGFNAQYAGGDIVLEDAEIGDAKWFTPDDMPILPGKISIARRLIDDWIERSGS
ncbi:MAG: NAD(+) diphosphatase [Thermomicrobiales bacterium]|nr:NAD(+) diphosphatase [Thermomicrobiales bacterium]